MPKEPNPYITILEEVATRCHHEADRFGPKNSRWRVYWKNHAAACEAACNALQRAIPPPPPPTPIDVDIARYLRTELASEPRAEPYTELFQYLIQRFEGDTPPPPYKTLNQTEYT